MMKISSDKQREARCIEKAAEVIAAAIYNARPYPCSWNEFEGTPGGALHDHFMAEGRRKLQEVMLCLDVRKCG